jgi:excisionase family DNA binding protein
MVVSVKEAAERLHLGEHRVRALISSGVLHADLIGGRYLVDDSSLEAMEASTRHAYIRSFSRRVAWAAAALADGSRPNWLSYSELSRLRRRMEAAGRDPAAWTARMRGRAGAVATYRAGRAVIGSLHRDQRLAQSGASATNLVTDRQITTTSLDLWCLSTADRDAIRTTYGLLPTARGNVRLQVADVSGLTQLGTGGNAFRLIVAADLLDAEDARSRSAGRALLDATLAERSWSDLA